MSPESDAGPLALVGGDEFRPGNETHDSVLVAHARIHGGPAFVIASAAREHPDAAVATAERWFAPLGLSVEELRLRTRGDASRRAIVEAASRGSFFYLAGGDPGRVPQVLDGTPAWDAVVAAWRGGAVLAGSSAGAMALGAWTLIRARMPGDSSRTVRPALTVVPGIAVVPHFETFGHRWLPSIRAIASEAGVVLLGLDERTAAIWQDGVWRAMGDGVVTLVDADGEWPVAPGAVIERLPQPRLG